MMVQCTANRGRTYRVYFNDETGELDLVQVQYFQNSTPSNDGGLNWRRLWRAGDQRMTSTVCCAVHAARAAASRSEKQE